MEPLDRLRQYAFREYLGNEKEQNRFDITGTPHWADDRGTCDVDYLRYGSNLHNFSVNIEEIDKIRFYVDGYSQVYLKDLGIYLTNSNHVTHKEFFNVYKILCEKCGIPLESLISLEEQRINLGLTEDALKKYQDAISKNHRITYDIFEWQDYDYETYPMALDGIRDVGSSIDRIREIKFRENGQYVIEGVFKWAKKGANENEKCMHFVEEFYRHTDPHKFKFDKSDIEYFVWNIGEDCVYIKIRDCDCYFQNYWCWGTNKILFPLIEEYLSVAGNKLINLLEVKVTGFNAYVYFKF